MKSLVDIVEKTWKFLKYEKINLALISGVLLTSYFSFFEMKRVFHDVREFKKTVVSLEERGIDYRITAENTYFKPGITEELKKGNLQVRNSEGEYVTLLNPYKSNKVIYGLLCGLITGILIADKRKKLRVEYSPIEHLKEKGLRLIGAGMALSHTINTSTDLNTLETVLIGYVLLGGFDSLIKSKYRNSLIEKAFKESVETNNIEKMVSNPYYIVHLRKEAEQAYKEGSDDVWKLTLDVLKFLKTIPKKHDDLGYATFNPLVRFGYLKDHLKAVINPTYHNLLNLILIGARNYKDPYEMDIENMTLRADEHITELMQLDFEFTTEKQARKRKAVKLYRKLVEEGKITGSDIQTNNLISFMACGKLGLQYALKKGKASAIDQEKQQTEVIQDVFKYHSEISIPEISTVFSNQDLPELEDEKIMWVSYIEGDTLIPYLKKLYYIRRQVKLLDKIIEANAVISKYGINSEQEDLERKAISDIETNQTLNEYLTNTELDNLKNAIVTCLKYSDLFELVYDRDGNPGNCIITKESGKIVLLDHEARKKSDMIYMAIKAIEQSQVLPYDEIGYKERNYLIRRHFEHIGIVLKENQTDLQETHYYSGVPVKAYGFLNFSQNKPGLEQARMTFVNSALFSLEILLEKYQRQYNSSQIRDIQHIHECTQKIKQGIISNLS
jgi:hypothetical protein